jgi:hypothetical protein
MSDLQIGLAIIGVLAVVGVLLYNRWQERSARREAQKAFASGHNDVLLDGRREPTIEAPVPPAPSPAPPVPPLVPRVASADKVDYVIELGLTRAVAPPQIHEGWAVIERRFSRRTFLDERSRSHLRAALQLVSRDGVVSDAELLEFRSMVETLGAEIGAVVRAPEMRSALEAARELDRTCADADIQVALHVVGVDAAAAQFANQPFQATPRQDGVTLTIDVARTPEPARSYEAMARAGRDLAQSRGGRLVDDEGRDLDERALAAIGRELESVRLRLAGCGIEAGSPLALRVFS